jgi:hypothetical protein
LLEKAVVAVAAQSQAPPELVAHHILTLAAMAAQRAVSLRLPTGAPRPVSCFFLSLVGAGEGRDAAEALTVDSVRLWERGFEEEYPMRAAAHAGGKDGKGAKGPAPVKHLDLFYEARSPVKADRYRGYTRQSGFFARHPHDLIQPRHPRRAEAATLCALWNGRVVKPAVGPRSFPRLSVHVVTTPRAGRLVMSDADLADSGLVGRVLVAAPASRLGARTFHAAENDDPPPAFDTLLEVLGEVFEKPPSTENRVIVFSGKAAARWLAFAAETEAAMTREGKLAPIRGFAEYLPEHAARLAVVVAFMNDDAIEELTEAQLETGIALARYYTESRLRLLGFAEPALSEAEKEDLLREWLQRLPPDTIVTLRDLCRAGPWQIRRAAALQTLMGRMELLGIVQPANDAIPRTSPPHGGRRRHAWRILAEEDAGEDAA